MGIQRLNLKPEQLELFSRGPDQPLVANTSEANRAKNRRVEIQIEPLISQ